VSPGGTATVVAVAAAFALVAAVASCSQDYAGSESDPGDASTAETAAGDAAIVEAGDAGDAGDAASGLCPGTGMLPVNAINGMRYCIDVTEVTQSAYKKFIVATGGKPNNQPEACKWNTTYIPPANGCTQSTYKPDETPDLPVTCVNWCDAHAYCEWAGKRLCGKIGGGATPTDSVFNASVDQWFAACSKHGTQSYPYGNTYDATKCNGDRDGGVIANVGSFSQCRGGVDDALLDMVGNVTELEDSCDEPDGSAPDQNGCALRGGAFNYTTASGEAQFLRCDSAAGGYVYIRRNAGGANVGFRCCADL